jgi:hypothetical protein
MSRSEATQSRSSKTISLPFVFSPTLLRFFPTPRFGWQRLVWSLFRLALSCHQQDLLQTGRRVIFDEPSDTIVVGCSDVGFDGRLCSLLYVGCTLRACLRPFPIQKRPNETVHSLVRTFYRTAIVFRSYLSRRLHASVEDVTELNIHSWSLDWSVDGNRYCCIGTAIDFDGVNCCLGRVLVFSFDESRHSSGTPDSAQVGSLLTPNRIS